MKKKLVILLSISLLTCSCGLAGCAAQKENKTEVSVTNLDVSQSTETADNTSEPDKKSNLDSSNSKESTAVSSTVEESGKDTTSSVAESAEPSQSTPSEVSHPSNASASESSQSTQEIPKGTLTPSPEVGEKYKKLYFYESTVSDMNYDYPNNITQEQFDQILVLRLENLGSKLPYQEGVIMGTVDPSAPRLTLEKAEEIIADVESRKLESDKTVFKNHQTIARLYPECYGGYIYNEFCKIQPPDFLADVCPFQIQFYLSFNEEGVPTEKLILTESGTVYTINYYAMGDESGGNGVFEGLYEPM